VDDDSTPLTKRKLSDLVEERLLDRIQSGDMAPGDVFPSERELMERFQVGRPAIREAMQSLQRMGLVDIRHGERPRVAMPSMERAIGELGETMRHLLTHSQDSLEHLKEARLVFEMEMTRIAARLCTADDLARLQSTLDSQASATKDSAAFMKRDGDFHRAIAAISGNPIFVSLSSAIFTWLSNFHAHLVRSPGLEKVTLSEHQAILNAIGQHKVELAAEQMRDHLTRANSLYSSANIARGRAAKDRTTA
jgi:DNA-binding FadR family transcriptional regulator